MQLSFNVLKDKVTDVFTDFKNKEGLTRLTVSKDKNGNKVEFYFSSFESNLKFPEFFIEETQVLDLVVFFNLKLLETFDDLQPLLSGENLKIFELLTEDWITFYIELENDELGTTYKYSALIKGDNKKEFRKTKTHGINK